MRGEITKVTRTTITTAIGAAIAADTVYSCETLRPPFKFEPLMAETNLL